MSVTGFAGCDGKEVLMMNWVYFDEETYCGGCGKQIEEVKEQA